MWRTAASRRSGGVSRRSSVPKPADAQPAPLRLLERGELGVNQGPGLLEVDQAPGAEPVVAGDLGDPGGVQAAAGLELLEQHAGDAGVDQGQRDRGHRGHPDIHGGVVHAAAAGTGPGRHHPHEDAVHVGVAGVPRGDRDVGGRRHRPAGVDPAPERLGPIDRQGESPVDQGGRPRRWRGATAAASQANPSARYLSDEVARHPLDEPDRPLGIIGAEPDGDPRPDFRGPEVDRAGLVGQGGGAIGSVAAIASATNVGVAGLLPRVPERLDQAQGAVQVEGGQRRATEARA